MFDLNELKKYGLMHLDLDLADVSAARLDISSARRNISLVVLEESGPGGGNPHVLLIGTPVDLRWILREWCFDEEFISEFFAEAGVMFVGDLPVELG